MVCLLFVTSNYAENSATLAWTVNCIFKEICVLLSVYFYYIWYIEKFKGKIIHTRCGNKETGLLLLLISGQVDDEEEDRALTHGLPSTVTQRFIHAHRLVSP